MLGEHDGGAGLAVDAAAPAGDHAGKPGRDRLESADMAGRDGTELSC
jgi:hypothetical protein